MQGLDNVKEVTGDVSNTKVSGTVGGESVRDRAVDDVIMAIISPTRANDALFLIFYLDSSIAVWFEM